MPQTKEKRKERYILDRNKVLLESRELYHLRRERWFAEKGPCIICTSWERLEVDHIERGTKISHRIWNWSEERRSKELEKCQVLCHKCHQEKTFIEVWGLREHGTIRMYRNGKCRCIECKEAQRIWHRGQR